MSSGSSQDKYSTYVELSGDSVNVSVDCGETGSVWNEFAGGDELLYALEKLAKKGDENAKILLVWLNEEKYKKQVEKLAKSNAFAAWVLSYDSSNDDEKAEYLCTAIEEDYSKSGIREDAIGRLEEILDKVGNPRIYKTWAKVCEERNPDDPEYILYYIWGLDEGNKGKKVYKDDLEYIDECCGRFSPEDLLENDDYWAVGYISDWLYKQAQCGRGAYFFIALAEKKIDDGESIEDSQIISLAIEGCQDAIDWIDSTSKSGDLNGAHYDTFGNYYQEKKDYKNAFQCYSKSKNLNNLRDLFSSEKCPSDIREQTRCRIRKICEERNSKLVDRISRKAKSDQDFKRLKEIETDEHGWTVEDYQRLERETRPDKPQPSPEPTDHGKGGLESTPTSGGLDPKPTPLPPEPPSPQPRRRPKAVEIVLRKKDGSINWEALHDNSIWVAILDSVPPNKESLKERSFPKYYDVSQKIGLEKMLADERFLQEFNGAHAYNWPDQMHFRGRSHLQLGLFLEACGEPETADYCYNAYRKSDPGCRRFAVYRDEIE